MNLGDFLKELAKIGIADLTIPLDASGDMKIKNLNALLNREDISLESRITTVHPAYSAGEWAEHEAHEQDRQI